MIITAILYKPDGVQSYRSCVTGRFCSNLEIIVSDKPDIIIEKVSLALAKPLDHQEEGYSVTYLVNGYVIQSDNDYTNEHEDLNEDTYDLYTDVINSIKLEIQNK